MANIVPDLSWDTQRLEKGVLAEDTTFFETQPIPGRELGQVLVPAGTEVGIIGWNSATGRAFVQVRFLGHPFRVKGAKLRERPAVARENPVRSGTDPRGVSMTTKNPAYVRYRKDNKTWYVMADGGWVSHHKTKREAEKALESYLFVRGEGPKPGTKGASMRKPPKKALERYSKADLERMPTLSTGQAEDLKVQEEIGGTPTRWWLSRVTHADGATHAVSVEQLREGRWVVVHDYGRPDPNPTATAPASVKNPKRSRRIVNPFE